MERSSECVHELLYMGSEASIAVAENVIDESMRDPFEIVAEIEEDIGYPLAFS